MSLQAPPHLLPQNRKLRHLRGIYLRNLTFTRLRGHTTDDATINKSPEKLESLRQGLPLHHTRSSENLRSSDQARSRRVTLSSSTAFARQRILEQVLESSTADAFFSLHCEPDKEPIYVSEVEERSTNFNFRLFDLSVLDPSISRSSQVTVKIWLRRSGFWSLLVEDEVDLRFLGSVHALKNSHLPPNCVVFHLVDGIYIFGANSNDIPFKQGASLPTSSYTSLMSLSNLENSFRDSLTTQSKLGSQIDEHLAHRQHAGLPDASITIQRVHKGGFHQQRLVEASRKKRDDLRASIASRRAAIALGRSLQKKAQNDVANAAKNLSSSKTTAAATMDNIRGQRRRICEDLIHIFSVIPTPQTEPLSFQICGIHLPNTEYGPMLSNSTMGEEVLSAALGYVAVLANALQSYLSIALPYKITPFGSRSIIRDGISKIPDQQRDFPLYIPRGGLNSQYRFDYGWFLLNKNIETLCNAQGLKVVDIRHTLPNLKYLLYVCSAGSEELPQRKRGGVRGLWARHLQRHSLSPLIDDDSCLGAANSQRDSAVSVVAPAKHSQNERLSDAGKTEEAGPGKEPPNRIFSSVPGLNLPFDETAAPLTLRTKGMREHVGG